MEARISGCLDACTSHYHYFNEAVKKGEKPPAKILNQIDEILHEARVILEAVKGVELEADLQIVINNLHKYAEQLQFKVDQYKMAAMGTFQQELAKIQNQRSPKILIETINKNHELWKKIIDVQDPKECEKYSVLILKVGALEKAIKSASNVGGRQQALGKLDDLRGHLTRIHDQYKAGDFKPENQKKKDFLEAGRPSAAIKKVGPLSN